MSKLADARGLNICLAWREHICLCYRIVMSRHNVNLRLTANKGSVSQLNCADVRLNLPIKTLYIMFIIMFPISHAHRRL